MTDEELLEAAADAYWRVQCPEIAPPLLTTVVGLSAPGIRAALEVFRREQGARDEALRGFMQTAFDRALVVKAGASDDEAWMDEVLENIGQSLTMLAAAPASPEVE